MREMLRWLLHKAGPIFAFYVVIEGLLRGYEYLTGHHFRITENETALVMLGVFGNIIFGAHFLYAAWESRDITLGVVTIAIVGAVAYGLFVVTTQTLPQMGKDYLDAIASMPDGTVFMDPYTGELMVKDGIMIHPLNGPFKVDP